MSVKSKVDRSMLAVAASQGALATTSVISIDGIWGKATQQAYATADQNVKRVVKYALDSFGVNLSDFVKAEDVWMDRTVIVALINNELGTGRYDRALTADLILQIAAIETNTRFTNGQQYRTNAVSPNGKFKGLFQMGSSAWADARKWHHANTGHELGEWSSSAFDGRLNTLAALAYMQVAVEQLRSIKVPITKETIYAVHNQGFTGFKNFLKAGPVAAFERTAVKAQSVTAKEWLARAYQAGKSANYA